MFNERFLLTIFALLFMGCGSQPTPMIPAIADQAVAVNAQAADAPRVEAKPAAKIPDGEKVFLSDLQEEAAEVGFGKFGKNGQFNEKGTKITVDGKPYEHGLGMHPDNASVDYRLDKKFETFRATVAINDSGKALRPVIFVVEGDGTKLWESRGLKAKASKADVVVNIKGVSRLCLRTFFLPNTEGRGGAAHAVWLDPSVEKQPPPDGLLPRPTPEQLARRTRMFENGQLLIALLKAEKFAELEKVCQDAFKSKDSLAGTPLGTHVLDYLGNPTTQSEATWQAHFEKLAGWKKAFPNSTPCDLTQAKSWMRYAWRARGEDIAINIAKSNFEAFRERAQKADECLDRVKARGDTNAQYHALKISTAVALPMTPEAMKREFNAGINQQPLLTDLVSGYVQQLLPQWGGTQSSAVELADELLTRNPNGNGEILYALIATDVAFTEGVRTFTEFQLDYAKVRRGAIAWLRQNPDADRLTQTFCQLACLQQDKELASELFSRFGDNSVRTKLWYQQPYVDSWREWAASGAPPAELQSTYAWPGGIVAIAFQPDGKQLFVGGDNDRVYSLSLPSGQRACSFRTPAPYEHALAVHPREKLLLVYSGHVQSNHFEGQILPTDAAPRLPQIFKFEPGTAEQFTISPDGKRFAAVGGAKQAFVWQFDDLKNPAKLEHPEKLFGATFLADGRLIVSTREGGLFAWTFGDDGSPQQETLREVHKGPWLQKLAPHPDSKHILCAALDGSVQFYNLEEKKGERTPERRENPAIAVAISRDGKLGAIGRQSGEIEIYSLPELKLVRTLPGHFSRVQCVAFSPTEDILASGAHDCMVRIWNVSKLLEAGKDP
ncbi:NPCBM/NEW2 domain-containing protein [Anatilimnocola floriformis]|uniref:NPCBM/NEW2 domain-containing protein n=1 Tax=Anatilimnocola floriformis TaxID=2948575 RepID=UPI0020C29002|nr:NPCBM/NEW2 domain-containing protein [Anatilimnocola floriformis]